MVQKCSHSVLCAQCTADHEISHNSQLIAIDSVLDSSKNVVFYQRLKARNAKRIEDARNLVL
jgi:hypothetical protein